MIQIIPIPLPFFGNITQVKPLVKDFNLLENVAVITLELYSNTGELYKSIEQPIAQEIMDNWGTDNTPVVDWALAQNGIQRLA